MQLSGLCSGNGTSMADTKKEKKKNVFCKLVFTTESNRTSHVKYPSLLLHLHNFFLSVPVLQLYIYIYIYICFNGVS